MKTLNVLILCRPSQRKTLEELVPAMWVKNFSETITINAYCLSMERQTRKGEYEIYFDYGISRVFLVSDKEYAGSDTYSTACILGQAIRELEIPFDIILTNTLSAYGETGHVPVQVADFLGIPFGINATELIPASDSIVCKQLFESYEESVNIKYPCLISLSPTMSRDFVEKNTPTLFDMANSKGIIEVFTQQDLNINPMCCGLQGSHTLVEKSVRLINEKKHDVFSSEDDGASVYLQQLIIGA